MFWACRSLALLVFFLNDTVAIQHREGPTLTEIVIEWPSPVEYTATADGRELLLQFNRPIDAPDTGKLAEQLPQWLEAVTASYDAVLLRASRDVIYDVRAEGSTIVIRMDAAPPKEPVPAAETEGGELRLDILRAQLLTAERQHGPAEQLLERLTTTHPRSVPALSSLGQVEQQIGRWRRAYDLYGRVLQLDPRNQDVRELRSEVLAEHGSRVGGDAEIKQITDERTERITRFAAQVLLRDDVRMGVVIDHNYTTIGGRDYNRDRAEVSGQHDSSGGSSYRLSAFGTRGRLGGGFRYDHADSAGTFYLQGDYRRPFWEFLETIAGYGTRDRAEIHRNQRLGRFLDARLTTALNRYSLRSTGNAAGSLAFDGGISRAMLRSNPYLALEYSFDKESVRHLQENTIPLVSREVHAGSINAQFRFSRRVVAEGFGGFVRDRLGQHGRGPFLGARVTRGGPSRLGLQVWFERRRNSVATGQIVNRAGAYVYWRL